MKFLKKILVKINGLSVFFSFPLLVFMDFSGVVGNWEKKFISDVAETF